MRLSSHGMAGTSNSSHATVRLSGDHAGSSAKSAPVDSRTGHGPAGDVDATAMSRVSTTYATRVPSGATAGAATGPGPATSCTGGPPVTDWRHSPPSMAAYTSALPSGHQSNAPPP